MPVAHNYTYLLGFLPDMIVKNNETLHWRKGLFEQVEKERKRQGVTDKVKTIQLIPPVFGGKPFILTRDPEVVVHMAGIGDGQLATVQLIERAGLAEEGRQQGHPALLAGR